MSAAAYAEALDLIDRLEVDERRRLLMELATRLEQSSPKRSVAEFRGVGKHNPIGMDAQDFINQERDSWTG